MVHPSVQHGGPGVMTRSRAQRGGGCVRRRGVAGRRMAGPAEIKASSDGRGALTHRMPADLGSSFDESGVLTHWMMADTQRSAYVPAGRLGHHSWALHRTAGGLR